MVIEFGSRLSLMWQYCNCIHLIFSRLLVDPDADAIQAKGGGVGNDVLMVVPVEEIWI